jgi:hypothetical protein
LPLIPLLYSPADGATGGAWECRFLYIIKSAMYRDAVHCCIPCLYRSHIFRSLQRTSCWLSVSETIPLDDN